MVVVVVEELVVVVVDELVVVVWVGWLSMVCLNLKRPGPSGFVSPTVFGWSLITAILGNTRA